MASNEIVEKLVAAAWVRVGAVSDADQNIDPAHISFRSAVGISTAQIVTPVNVNNFPILLIRLTDTQVRAETIVHADGIMTSDDEGRFTYGQSSRVQVQPFKFSWIGDFASPDWVPFAPAALVPPGENIEQFDGIALSLALGEGIAAVDVCFSVWKLPRVDGGVTVINNTLAFGV